MVALATPDRDRLLLVPALRGWTGRALRGLARRRAEIDALNVYPVADADTGTNLLLTVRDGCRALAAAGPAVTAQQAAAALDRGVLLGARGNSGVILSQLLHGALATLTAREDAAGAVSGAHLRPALVAAARAAVAAVARPVDGTILTVAAAAADAVPADPADWDSAVDAAVAAAAEALARTPTQLDVLAEAGVVDAGGAGLLVLLEALRTEPGPAPGSSADGGAPGTRAAAPFPPSAFSTSAFPRSASPPRTSPPSAGEPAARFEVMYVVEAAAAAEHPGPGEASAVDDLRRRLDALGDSVLVVGGTGLWKVHVHTAQAGPAVEAGFALGRPREVRVTALAPPGVDPGRSVAPTEYVVLPAPAPSAGRRHVVAVLGERAGDGLVALVEAAGGAVIRLAGVEPGELVREGSAKPGGDHPAGEDRLVSALSTLAGSTADEVVLLAADRRSLAAAHAAARKVRERGLGREHDRPRRERGEPRGTRGAVPDVQARVAVVPSAATVQVLAALAVHDAARPLAEDLAAMAAAAAGTRHGGVTVAAREAMTTAGPCRPGDVLGVIGGDFVIIGSDAFDVATEVADRLLQGGGELVTLVVCPAAPPGLAAAVTEHVHASHPEVDVSVHPGGPEGHVLLVGVE